MRAYPVQILFREYFEGILAAIFLALFLRFFILSVMYLPTEAMEPSIQRGDFVVGWRVAYGFPLPLMKGERVNFKMPKRGDVISFRFPGDEEQLIVRRVVGLPGDSIQIVEGVLYLNGKPCSEPILSALWEESLPQGRSYWIHSSRNDNMPLVKVPKDSLFVLSDNRQFNDDSRDWGMVSVKNLESRLSFIWLSLDTKSPQTKIRGSRIFSAVH